MNYLVRTHTVALCAVVWTATAASQTNSFPDSGNVGIGASTPTAKLEVQAAVNGGRLMATGEGGGTYNTINSFASDGSSLTGLVVRAGNYSFGGNNGKAIMFAGDGMYCRWMQAARSNSLVLGGAYGAHLIINPAGNVGIGTTNPTNKLEVAGTNRVKEVIVETTGWADHVLAPDYQLVPLSEVEVYSAARGTLPGFPLAGEAAEQGVSFGEMQAKLLAKIEELTLRQIAQEKEIHCLRTEIAALKAD